MKKGAHTLLRAACFFMLFSSAVCVASAQDKTSVPGAPAPADAATQPGLRYNIRIDVLMVAIPEDKFITLLPDLLDKDKIEKTVPELLEAVKRKEMILEGFQFIVTKSGQRAVAETTTEVSHEEFSVRPIGGEPAIYETRNIGVTFEVEPTISPDGRIIDIDLAPQQVDQLKSPAGVVPKSADPLYFTMNTTTSLALASGQHLLIGTHKMVQPAGYVEVFILHADADAAGK